MKEGERAYMGKKEAGVDYERRKAGLTVKKEAGLDYERRSAGLTGKERDRG